MAAQPIQPFDPVDAIMWVMERAFDPAFGEAWNRRQVSDALLLGTCDHALIDHVGEIGEAPPGQPAGFYLSRRAVDEEEFLLFAIAPEFRGRGLGRDLLAYFVGQARARGSQRLFLEMRRGNPALALYERLGFRSVGIRPGYYHGAAGVRIDAITLEKILD